MSSPTNCENEEKFWATELNDFMDFQSNLAKNEEFSINIPPFLSDINKNLRLNMFQETIKQIYDMPLEQSVCKEKLIALVLLGIYFKLHCLIFVSFFVCFYRF